MDNELRERRPEGGGVGVTKSEPTVSIRVVVRRTGIAIDTLRVWERRYGFPKPERSAGGMRFYTEDDVVALELISAAISRGFRPNEVVGKSVKELQILLGQASATSIGVKGPRSDDDRVLDVEDLISILRADDARGLKEGLRTCAAKLGTREFLITIAQPLASRVGELWESGELEIRHEHLMSECLDTQLRHMLSSYEDNESSPTLLLTTLPTEAHALGITMVAVYAALRGVQPRLLGPMTPVDQIAQAAIALGANAVGITVTMVSAKEMTTKQVGQLLLALPRKIDVWVGGEGAAKLKWPKGVKTLSTWDQLDETLRELQANYKDNLR